MVTFPVDDVLPAPETLATQPLGDVDTAFWQRIYSPADAYGGKEITGWAARFYPYLKLYGTVDRPNPLLELRLGEPRDMTTDIPGIRSHSVPGTLSKVIVNVNDQVAGENRAVALHAGLVGVAQDDDGALRPIAGWHVASAPVQIDDVIDRIVRDHVTTPAPPEVNWGWGWTSPSGDVIALYNRIGSATLFDGAWRIRPFVEQCNVWFGDRWDRVVAAIDLADGRCIGAINDVEQETTHWVVCRAEAFTEDGRQKYRLVDEPADVPVLGTSLAMLLDAALDSGGDITHLETGRLDQLIVR
ncbi:DUF4419 domain-containing protein [Actinocrispum wychmicini]|uniref:Uncharacterized protein DUF4419 n=1 Tax=Actinocrispum wychmicini TaxID=1213861 RepID=A0A4R2J778_9PSEU|nr:DUF4419 domain-containing protein [Actinocrispum wychmicini]TCO53462.1 uncharacterized protein DUF4419 [Actinocrispum wychmicini]